MKTRLLFVCLGNICRSPAAEAVFLNLIRLKGLEDKYQIDSAGTGGWHVGGQADSRMRAAAKKRGVLIESRARQINLKDFKNFDLILTMDHDNLEVVNSLAREVGAKPKARVKEMLSYARKTTLLEVPDPYYGGETGFENVLDLLEDACEGLLEELSVEE